MCFGSRDDDPGPAPRRRSQKRRQETRHQDVPLQRINITGPVTPPGQVPAPERDERGLWREFAQHEVTSQVLLTALDNAAQFLHHHGENLVLVAVGGAVNTIFLKTRKTTHDVDFFCPLLSEPHLSNLRHAGRVAVERSPAPLSQDWLNNATARMPGVVENINSLVRDATTQNAVIFCAPGLKVVAAPWNYSFIKKVSRITQGTGRPYDASDAVAYLYQFITRKNTNKPVTFQTIQQWGRQYKALCPIEVLQEINDIFQQTYGFEGIVFLGQARSRGAAGRS
ncbi:hypothetical protein QQS21_007445 [Conoideocrella luteorostrata]|uniref:Uncharacterized protein n=1 Tax=Conoideocrella luteorostrata TaxID=1105319 RepID=A0AAJ0CNI2_9HYPO|nr:hypothetical protein QQS21_007445 [Conoideocrella luteorostrata]